MKTDWGSFWEMMFVSAGCLFVACLGFRFGMNEFGVIGCIFFIFLFGGTILALLSDLSDRK